MTDNANRLTISLSGQCLQHIPPEVLQQSGAVKGLDLSLNRGISVNGTLRSLVNVQKLDLSDCKLKSFPEDIQALSKLEELNLSCNEDLSGIPEVCPQFRQMKRLSLRKCGIATLQSWITTSDSLEELDLSENSRLTRLPASVSGLQSLRILRLNQCSITEVPSWIIELENLETLDLSWNSRLAILPPGPCSLTNLKTLNIGNCALKEIPLWFGQLTTLAELDLFSNKDLAHLPEWLSKLRMLKKLRLRRCSIVALPDWIGNLESLEELDLSENSRLTRLPLCVVGLQSLRILRLKQCGLTEIPPWTIRLKSLEMLDFSWNKDIATLPAGPCILTKLSTLTACKCALTELPLWFGQLLELETLDVSENRKLGRLPDGIMRLTQLKKLNLKWCEFKALPQWIGQLQSLQELDASRNAKLSALPESMRHLKNLKKLIVYLCELSDVPSWIGELESLEELELSRNKKITYLPEGMTQLRQLKKLHLRSCYFSEIPSWIGKLKSLDELNVFENRNITGLPESLSDLKMLKKLSLGRCSLSEVPHWFKQLEALEELDLTDNKLRTFPSVILELTKLQKLDLRNVYFQNGQENRITELPVALFNSSLSELSLDGNPLVVPPEEIWQQGMIAIKSYFEGMLLGSDSLCADTINMLGDTGAGKTSIARSLDAGCPTPADEDDRTRVMDHLKARLGLKTVNINDFGGHEIYQAVIPVFLPPGGLCILPYNLLESKKKQEDTVKRWLVTMWAKSSRVRVVVVGTRADQLTGDECKRREDKMSSFVKEFFNRCIAEIKSNMTEVNIDRSLEKILRVLSDADYCVRTLSCTERNLQDKLLDLRNLVLKKLNPPESLPGSWCNFITDLLSAKSGSAFSVYYTWEEVIKIRDKYLRNDANDETLKVILRYLVKTSQIIWLEHNAKLCQIVYHKPRRIIELCKMVLHHNESEEMKKAIASAARYQQYLDDYKRGIVTRHFIKRMLQQSEASHLGHISDLVDTTIEFMVNFNLLFSLKCDDGDHQFLMPINLVSSEPCVALNRSTSIDIDDYVPSITIRFTFIGSLLPISFFETSVMHVLSMARHSMKADVSLRHDGLMFRSNCVEINILRKDETMLVKGHAPKGIAHTNVSTLCKVFYPVIECIDEKINALWNGAPPSCTIECPACICHGNDTDSVAPRTRGKFEFYLRGLNSEPPFDHWFCRECRTDIPRSLVWPLSPDMVNQQDEKDVKKFFEDLRINGGFYGDQRHLGTLKKRFNEARPSLVDRLDSTTLEQLLDHFIAAREGEGLITRQQFEYIKSQPTQSDKVRAFLGVVESRGGEAINFLAEKLRTECKMPDLAECLQAAPRS